MKQNESPMARRVSQLALQAATSVYAVNLNIIITLTFRINVAFEICDEYKISYVSISTANLSTSVTSPIGTLIPATYTRKVDGVSVVH